MRIARMGNDIGDPPQPTAERLLADFEGHLDEGLVHSRRKMAPCGAICELRTEFKMLLWSSSFW
jgi:hypothetical protein